MSGAEMKDGHARLEMDSSTGGILESKGDGSGTSGVCIVVMGVSGTGKSTLGMALSNRLGLSSSYIEGDELHPKENVEKMSRGIPLSDEDRTPWLEVIREKAMRRCLGLDSNSSFGGYHEGEVRGGESDDGGYILSGEGRERRRGVVVTCSALKKSYRDILRGRQSSSSSSTTTATPPRLTEGEPEPPSLPPPHTTSMSMQTYFVWINGSKEVLQDRIGKRQGHFFKASMLDSQLKVLESPEGEEGVVVVPLEVDTEEQVRIAVEGLQKLNI